MFSSLRFRIIASFFAIVWITLTAAYLALFARFGGYQDEVTASTLRSVAAPVYYNLTLFAPPGDTRANNLAAGRRLRTELTTYLHIQAQESGVIVLLLDADGNVIEESTTDPALKDVRFRVPATPPRGPGFTDLPEGRFETADGRTLLYVTVATPRIVRAQPGGIYAIVVALPEPTNRDVWRDLAPRLFFSGAIGLAAATVVALVLWASLYRPLGRVTAGIRAVARGDFGQRVAVAGPTEVRGLAQDVNSMADSVQVSQRTLRDFLANVSHELKTPLTSIRGFSQALLDGTTATEEERTRAARVIDSESRRVLHLVDELLDLSRIESGQQRMDTADVQARELLSHIADVFSLRATERGVTFTIDEAGADLVGRADFDRIEQVLANLLDNAFRHTPAGGEVRAGARASGQAVEFYVEDTGSGIATDELPHVFDRFYRSDSDRATPGSGLGLAIAREIVRAHGGTISASARIGGGTRFAFTLPRAAR